MDVQHVRKLIRYRLGARQALNLDGLVEGVAMARPLVIEGLRTLVDEGEVEILKPLTADGARTDMDWVGASDRAVFCRLVRQTDGNWRWQQRQPVVSEARLCDCKEMEARIEPEGVPAMEGRKDLWPAPALSWS